MNKTEFCDRFVWDKLHVLLIKRVKIWCPCDLLEVLLVLCRNKTTCCSNYNSEGPGSPDNTTNLSAEEAISSFFKMATKVATMEIRHIFYLAVKIPIFVLFIFANSANIFML